MISACPLWTVRGFRQAAGVVEDLVPDSLWERVVPLADALLAALRRPAQEDRVVCSAPAEEPGRRPSAATSA
jgi:hypothetical protein